MLHALYKHHSDNTATAATACCTTTLQVTFGEATRGAERRATTPLYDNKAAGAGTITLGDASTASAASGTGTTMGTLLQVCNSISTVTLHDTVALVLVLVTAAKYCY
jgi:hypothetical protein